MRSASLTQNIPQPMSTPTRLGITLSFSLAVNPITHPLPLCASDLRALERWTCRNLVDLLLRGILYVLGKNLYLGHTLSFPMPNALQSV